MSDKNETLRNYVSDMLAVEQHIHQAIRQQENDDEVKKYPQASVVISRAEATLDNHIAALESHLEFIGGDPASPVKEAVTAVLGVAAGAIDMVRAQKVSKMLRDDYTALSLAAISYHMLHTTGMALQSQTTADLALRHLRDWAPIIIEISRSIHSVVGQDLQDDGFPVSTAIIAESERATSEAWRSAD